MLGSYWLGFWCWYNSSLLSWNNFTNSLFVLKWTGISKISYFIWIENVPGTLWWSALPASTWAVVHTNIMVSRADSWLSILTKNLMPPRCRGLFRGVATPAVLCHKEPPRHKREASKVEVGGFGCRWVLYGIRVLAPAILWSSQPMRAEPCWASTNESGPHWPD